MDDAGAIETTGTQIVYENRWMRLREDTIRRQDGSSGIYSVVEKPDFVVVPIAADGRLHLGEQFRYPVRGRYWEFPQGSWEGTPGADPLDIARGELREETGPEADELPMPAICSKLAAIRIRATISSSPRGCGGAQSLWHPKSKISWQAASRSQRSCA